jgi:hypothetical protein
MPRSRDKPSTRIRTAVSGAAAGAMGTLAMDLLWYSRYRRRGGKERFSAWEFSPAIAGWDQAPAPARVGRLLIRTILRRDVPVTHAATINNVMHWSYGTVWGAQLALVNGSHRPWRGLAFGLLVWSSDYVVLPAVGIYEPIWRYDRATLAKDLSAHLVYGVTTDAGLRALTGRIVANEP